MTIPEPRKPRLGILVGSIQDEADGVAQAVRSLAAALRRGNTFEIEIFSFGPDDTDLLIDGIPIHVSRIIGPAALGYAPGLLRLLEQRDLDCIHVHGLWLYLSVAARIWARRTGRPYLVSPHGMLDEWALANRRWKKRVARILYEDAHMNAATCLHALCEAEARSILKAGYNRPITIIPNGVDRPRISRQHPRWRLDLPESARILLFLGRVTPKKRVAALVKAWAGTRSAANAQRWHLVIVGPVADDYERELSEIAARNDLSSSIHFTGPAYGDDRSSAYAAADAFILPSMSEGLPMAVLEAFSFGLPVLMTPQCNIPEAFAAGAAIPIEPDEESIERGLLSLFAMDSERLAYMAENGLQLVRTRFDWSAVARKFETLYSDCISGAIPASDGSALQSTAPDKLRLSSLA